MTKTYPSLPEGPVVCQTCAKSGHHIEMKRDNLDNSYLEDLPLEPYAELQSYRCPDCETITVFRVR